MTPEQIRAAKFECDSGDWECARWLQEIAAQLAEQKAQLSLALKPIFIRSSLEAMPGVQCGKCGTRFDDKGHCPVCVPPARHVDPMTSGTDHARAILSPPAAAQSKPTANPIALRDRWARDRHGIEVPHPKNASEMTVRIWKAERKDLADKTPRLKVAWANPAGKGFVDAACFDEKLFPWIAAQSKEPTALLYVVQNGKYLNIVGVRA
jgi:hypothetical protein